MKRFGWIAIVAVLASCEQAHSRLDDVPKTPPSKAEAPPLGPNASLEDRVARLEQNYDKHKESFEFLDMAFEQNKQQMEQRKKQMEEREANEPAPDATFAMDVDKDVKAGQVDGPATAPVTLVKYFDFACPYCQQTSPLMDELVKDYGGKVRVVYKNFVVHPQVATGAHLASCAAAKQGKYLAFKHAFWDKGFGPYAKSGGKDQSAYSEEGLTKIAGEIGLDTAKLKTDMASDECKQQLAADQADAEKWHVSATPTFYVNGTVAHARGKDDFKAMIDEKLKVAEASGVSGADYYDKEIVGKGEKEFRSKKPAKTN